MKSWKNLSLLSLSLLMACSSHNKVAQETSQHHRYRGIASINADRGELSPKQVKKLLDGILHSYVLGQSLLYDFDQSLDKADGKAMDSQVYHELQAVRSMVDGFEHQIDEMYLDLVMITAHKNYSEHQKEKAQNALNLIGQFMEGMTTDKQQIPENLHHMILGNLREKMTFLYDELMAMHSDKALTQNDPEFEKVLHKNMVLLRATRLDFHKDMSKYVVDKAVLDKTIAELSKSVEFKKFKADVKKTSKDMKKFSEAVRGGRSTSADSIFPSTGAAGNITGRSFPANTWSLTYDDGPGAKTTATVLKNLKDRKLKATFFMLAKQVETLPTISQQIADAGMDIASHSYNHAQLTKVSGAALDKQISGSKKIIETKLDKKLKLFRLPYGAGVSSTTIRSKIAAAGMVHVFWNVDTLDWQDKNPNSILSRALKQMAANKNRGVVLFHDIHPQSVTASTMLMDHMIKNKIKVCTVQAVVDQLNKGLDDCQD